MKHRTLTLLPLLLLVLTLVFSAVAQDTPNPSPKSPNSAPVAPEIAFWNGLTGSDGVTLERDARPVRPRAPRHLGAHRDNRLEHALSKTCKLLLSLTNRPTCFLIHTHAVPQFQELRDADAARHAL